MWKQDTTADSERGTASSGLRRRKLLATIGTSALGISTIDPVAAEENDTERDVRIYQGSASISSPAELGEAITESSLWGAVTDIDFTGEYGQAEVFSSDQSLLGYPAEGDAFGVVSTGAAEEAPGSPSTFASTGFGTTGSGDLPSPFSGAATVRDAAYLTLTFEVPADAEQFSFSYRFATEEIPNWVGSQYQDFFAVGIEYPDGTTENVATLPGGEPVTVDNAASYASTPDDVIYNAVAPPVTNSVDVTEYQGETLTVHAGVADVRDTAYDSAVFLDAVGFGETVGRPEIAEITFPPTAVETDERGEFEVVVHANAVQPEDVTLEAPVTVKRRGDVIGTVTASLTRSENDETVTFEGALPRARDRPGTAEGMEFELDLTVRAGGDPVGDPITTSTFAFRTVDTVFGVAAKPNDVTPANSVANTNLLTLLYEQSAYVNRHYASGLGGMGAKGFDFRWLNVEGSSVLEDDGYLELDHGYSYYSDGGGLPDDSQEFVKEALDRCATEAGIGYDEYDTAMVTNGPYQNRLTHIFSRSFWRGTPLPRLRIPVINETVDLGEPTGMQPFDTEGGTIDGIYAPLNEDTWVHEFGHSLGPGLQIGFPDLYEIDEPFQNFGNVRGWGLMGGRDGKVLSSFCRTLGENPFRADDGWLDPRIDFHLIDDLDTDLLDLTSLELGDDARYIVSIWGYVSVDVGLKIPEVTTDWQFGIFLLEGRPGGDASFSAPYGYTPPLSPDPFGDDGAALFEFGLLDIDADIDGVKEIIDDITSRRTPDLITIDDAEAVDIDYIPPSPTSADRPTLRDEGDTYFHARAATTFEMTDDLDGGSATVALSRDTGLLGDSITFVVDILGDLRDYVDAQPSGDDDPLPPLDVVAETPDGRRVGIDPETGDVVNEIDGASVGGSVDRRHVTVPASEDVDVIVSTARLEDELAERGIEPPEEIGYKRQLFVDEDLTVNEYDGLPFLDGRVAISDETTTASDGTDTAVRSVAVEIEPNRLNVTSNGKFVTVHLGFDAAVDPSDLRLGSITLSGVQAVHDDTYGFTADPPTEIRDGRTYVTVGFPRSEVIDALDTGPNSPQIIGTLDDGLFRGRGSVTTFDPGSNGKGTDGTAKGGGKK